VLVHCELPSTRLVRRDRIVWRSPMTWRTSSRSKKTSRPSLTNGRARRFCIERSQRTVGRTFSGNNSSSKPLASSSFDEFTIIQRIRRLAPLSAPAPWTLRSKGHVTALAGRAAIRFARRVRRDLPSWAVALRVTIQHRNSPLSGRGSPPLSRPELRR
jgi:hypothetical protein